MSLSFYLFLSLFLSLCIYIYTYIYVCVHTCVAFKVVNIYIYIYMYIYSMRSFFDLGRFVLRLGCVPTSYRRTESECLSFGDLFCTFFVARCLECHMKYAIRDVCLLCLLAVLACCACLLCLLGVLVC